jgi:hypothetical protein
MFNGMFSKAVDQGLFEPEDAQHLVEELNTIQCVGRCVRLELAAADLRNWYYFNVNLPKGNRTGKRSAFGDSEKPASDDLPKKTND